MSLLVSSTQPADQHVCDHYKDLCRLYTDSECVILVSLTHTYCVVMIPNLSILWNSTYGETHISGMYQLVGHSFHGIVVKFKEINLKFQKVLKSSRCSKVRKSSRSTSSRNCYQKTLFSVL